MLRSPNRWIWRMGLRGTSKNRKEPDGRVLFQDLVALTASDAGQKWVKMRLGR